MSKAENNRKIIETYYKSIASGDFETVISLMHEDVVFNIVGETPYAGKWKGRDNVYGILDFVNFGEDFELNEVASNKSEDNFNKNPL